MEKENGVHDVWFTFSYIIAQPRSFFNEFSSFPFQSSPAFLIPRGQPITHFNCPPVHCLCSWPDQLSSNFYDQTPIIPHDGTSQERESHPNPWNRFQLTASFLIAAGRHGSHRYLKNFLEIRAPRVSLAQRKLSYKNLVGKKKAKGAKKQKNHRHEGKIGCRQTICSMTLCHHSRQRM